MSTSTSAVGLPTSSPARGAAEYPPSGDFDSRIQEFIDAKDFFNAVNLLIFSLGQTDLSREKETIFKYLFILLPHHNHKQYTQLCERLPALLKVARDEPSKQSQLAKQLAKRFIALTKELPLEQRIEYFISAQHFIAKAMKMETNPTAIKKCHQTASKHFVTLIFELLVKNGAFQTMIDETRRKVQADRLRAHVRQLEDLMRFCCDEEDHQIITTLHSQAIEVANAKNDELQAYFAPIFAMVGKPLSLPSCFSTERYQNALKTFRLKFTLLDPAWDIRAAQKYRFKAFRTFFKVLIDDILAIMGPPPCGFDLRAKGSIGREEMCPFSDLECLILIAEDSSKIREYFSLFVKILALQIASFGETPDATAFAFTCLDPPEMKGLYLDKAPNEDLVLIVTPSGMADMLVDRSLEGPQSATHMVLRTSSLYATDPTLHETYREKSRIILEACTGDPLKERALRHLEVRKTDYQQIWKTPFSSNAESVQLKAQFIEPLFHLLGDLALYDHVTATNTLEIIDALGNHFNVYSQALLKEAVSFLYTLRIEVQRFYSEQRDDIYFTSYQTLQRVFVAGKSIIDSLERIFYLIIFPFYHIQKLTSIQSLDLVNVAMTQGLSDPLYTQNPKLLIPLVRQTALFLERTHALAERHLSYYRHLGEIPKGEFLRQTYIDNLKDPMLIALLAKQSNSTGFRQEKRLKEEALFASVNAITTPNPPVEGIQVQVTSPCLEGPRYLHPDVAKQVLDAQGKIISQYESKHRVTSLVWQRHQLHCKMWPLLPLMEYALFDLYYRIAGQLSPANTLACFTVIHGGKTIHFPVLISETLDHSTLSTKAAAGDPFSNIDVKQWSWLILCSILTRTGDGRLSNYVISHLGKIFAIDNDVAFVFPTQENLLFSKINFASALFFLTQTPPPLDPEVLEKFLALDFDLILYSWLEEVIAKEKEYNSLFNKEGKPVVVEVPATELRSPEKDSFTSSILFPPGAIVACRLQAARLKSAILKAQDTACPVSCFDLLKEFISLRTDLPLVNKVGERIFRAYTAAQQQPTVATRYAAAIGAKATSSLTLAQVQKASFQTPPSQKEIEEATYSSTEALKELLAVIGQADDRVSYTTSSTGQIILQGYFVHLQSAEGPNLLRQELVIKYVTYLFENSKKKPTCVVLTDCEVLNRFTLKPFLHQDLIILDLRNSPQITSRCLLDIATMCPQLEELYLCQTQIGSFPQSFLTFSTTVQFPKLRIMQITESPRLTSLQINTPQLEYLNLSSNPLLDILHLTAVHFFPRIVFKNSPLVLELAIEDLRQMLASKSGLSNAVEFYKEMFRNLIGDDHVLSSFGDASTYFVADAKHDSALLESRKKIKGTTRQLLNIARILRYIGDCLYSKKKYQEALEMYQKTLEIQQQSLTPNHPDIAESLRKFMLCLDNLGEHLQAQGKYNEALEIFQRALNIRQQSLDPDHPDIAKNLSKIGNCLHSLGKYQEALEKLEKALEIQQQSLDPDHPDIAKNLSKIGNCLEALGKYQEALEKYESALEKYEKKALKIRQEPLIYFNPYLDIANSLDNIGDCLEALGKHQEALEKYEKALGIRQKSLPPDSPDILISLGKIGNCLYSQGNYQEALEIFQRVLELEQKCRIPDNPNIARSLGKIGNCLYSQGKYQEALEIFQRVLELEQKHRTPDNPDIARSFWNIGNCLYSQGKYQEALEKHERALEIRQKTLPSNHPDIAKSLDHIGNCLFSQGKYQEALEKHERALEIRQKSLTSNHHDIAKSLSNIGNCLEALGKYQEALEKHERALESLNPNHRNIAESLSNIGNCLEALGKYKEALEKHERALAIRQYSLDPNHPDIAISLCNIVRCSDNLGNCLKAQGKYKEALEKHKRALGIRQTSLNPDHPDIAKSLSFIGDCLYSLGKYKEALEKHERALEIRQKSLDPNHPDIVKSLTSIGLCFKAQGKYQEALEKLERALEIRQKSLDPNHPDIANSLTSIGLCLYSQGKYQEALEKFEEALEIRKKSLDPDHPDIAKSLSNFGACLYSQGKYQEALEKCERALEIRQKSLDPYHPDIATSLYNIGACLYFQGKYQEALEKHIRACGIRLEFSEYDNIPVIAKSFNSIGLCYEAQGKYQEALEQYEMVLKAWQRFSPIRYHPEIAKSLSHIGSCLEALGKYQEALEKYERTLENWKKIRPPNHPAIAKSLDAIRRCHNALS